MDSDENTLQRLIRQSGGDFAPRLEHRAHLRERVLDAFDYAETQADRPAIFLGFTLDWRQTMRHPIPRVAAAVIFILALAGVALWFHGGGTTAAFADFIQPILDAKSAKFTMDYQVEGQPPQNFQVTFLEPNHLRQDLPGGVVNISDFDQAKMVSLDPKHKRMTVMTLANLPKEKLPQNFFAQLQSQLLDAREKPSAAREPLGEKEIDGHRVVGYRVTNPAQVLTVWGDPATGLPVRIESDTKLIPKVKTVWTHFEFNIPVKASLFSMMPPAGYTVVDVPVDVSPPTENDLIATLRQYAQMTGGTFPDAFDTPSTMRFVQKLMTKLGVKQQQEPSPEQQRELMETILKLNRGFMFALQLPPEADANYAGKDVKRDSPDTPMFWYRPKGTKQYRVIYADLSVREAATPPSVANAQPLRTEGGPQK